MKRQLLFLISTFCLILYSCDDSENDSLKVSQSSFNNISCDGTTLEVDIISSSDWTVSKTAKWCNVTPAKGSGNQKLTLEIEANLEETTRNATITITPSNGGISQAIKITQNGITASFNPETYHYKLPVIFHVLYHDKTIRTNMSRLGDYPKF